MPASLPLSPFRRAAAEAVAGALGMDPLAFAVTDPPDPALGDLAVGCFPAAKTLRAAPPALAQKVAQAFQPTAELAAATAAGPYVNFRVDRAAILAHLVKNTLVDRTPVPPVGAGKTVLVDYSSPNIAKPLAYHHIRSTCIGQALVNIHRALGYRTVGINHLGDWGTTFGMLLAACEKWGIPEPLSIEALNKLYADYRTLAKEDPAAEDAGRAWFKKLEDGDAATRQLWQRFRDESLAEFQEVYDALGVAFDEVRGESQYESAMPAVIEMLKAKGLTEISDEALVVPLADMPPLLLTKKDGSTLYATRDLAAALYRWETYHFDRSLYVVDKGQGLHFKQLFTTLKLAGYPFAEHMEHVPFGLVRIGGKRAGSRKGNVVLLKEVLGEAQARVSALLAETNPDLSPGERNAVSRDVGTGVVVFSNLIAQREKDIDFEWEDIVSLTGDSAPYVQYSHARAASILRRAGVTDASQLAGADAARLEHPEEWTLVRLLTDLPDATLRAALADEPHVLARYLLDVCAAFSRWYTLGNSDPARRVLSADEATRKARLALTGATEVTIRVGLGMLGLQAPDVM